MIERKEGENIVDEIYNRDNRIIKIDNIYKISKSTVLIEYESSVGTGFFIKFMKNNNKPLYCLMTSGHIITTEMIADKKNINISYDNKGKNFTIELNIKERIIESFLYMKIDAVIVEILKKDKIKEDYFLSPCEEKDYDYEYKNLINRQIEIIQFPKGKDLSISKGKIIEIDLNDKYRFSYNVSTKKGSSGGPIFFSGKERVIGIHKGGNENKEKNYGELIGPIHAIINQFKKNGEGVEYYENGKKKYEGYFLNDEYEGNGTFYYENGDIYIGEFKKGKKNGNGIIFDSKSKIKKEGIFEDDVIINENNEENEEDEENEEQEEDEEDEQLIFYQLTLK